MLKAPMRTFLCASTAIGLLAGCGSIAGSISSPPDRSVPLIELARPAP